MLNIYSVQDNIFCDFCYDHGKNIIKSINFPMSIISAFKFYNI